MSELPANAARYYLHQQWERPMVDRVKGAHESPDYNENRIEGRDNEVRQGVTGHNVRYVLGVSLAAVIIVMVIIAAFVMHS